MLTPTTPRISARKVGRNATRYSDGRTSVTFWPFGRGYSAVIRNSVGVVSREFCASRADAVMVAGEWMDASHGGRFIIDNDKRVAL